MLLYLFCLIIPNQTLALTVDELLTLEQQDWLTQAHEAHPRALEQALKETIHTFDVLKVNFRTTMEIVKDSLLPYGAPLVPVVFVVSHFIVNNPALTQVIQIPGIDVRSIISSDDKQGLISGTSLQVAASLFTCLYCPLSSGDKQYLSNLIKSPWTPSIEPWNLNNMSRHGIDLSKSQALHSTFFALLKINLLSRLNPEFEMQFKPSCITNIIGSKLIPLARELGFARCLEKSNHLRGIQNVTSYSEAENSFLMKLHLDLPLAIKTFNPQERSELLKKLREELGLQQMEILQDFLAEMLNPTGRRNTAFFIGGPGTGKTYTAKKIAEITGLPIGFIQWRDVWGYPQSFHNSQDSYKFLEALASRSKEGKSYRNCIILIDEGDHCLQKDELQGDQFSILNQFLSDDYWRQHKLGYPVCIKHLNVIITANRLPLADEPNDQPRKRSLLSRMSILQFPAIVESRRQAIAWEHFAKPMFRQLEITPSKIDLMIIKDVISVLDGFVHAGVRDLERLVGDYIHWRSMRHLDVPEKKLISDFFDSAIFTKLTEELILRSTDPVTGKITRDGLEPFEKYLSGLFNLNIRIGRRIEISEWKSVVEGAAKPEFFN